MDHNLFKLLMMVTMFGSICLTIYHFTIIMTNYILKKRMIDKGYVNEDAQAVFKQYATTNNKYASLKWGLIIFFAGLSLILMEFIPVQPESPLPYGLFAVSVSLGFLIYYYIVKTTSGKK